jgi:bifunctional DNA-binding transcriptional regulator/antitoxin component of YhaV-PrlF toxin-antitoxin module
VIILTITKKYYHYEKGQSTIDIPVKVAEDAGWNIGDDIDYSIEQIKKKKGIFLWKERKNRIYFFRCFTSLPSL